MSLNKSNCDHHQIRPDAPGSGYWEHVLTGHVKSNGNLIVFKSVKFIEFSPATGVAKSPNVHGDVKSTWAW